MLHRSGAAGDQRVLIVHVCHGCFLVFVGHDDRWSLLHLGVCLYGQYAAGENRLLDE